MTRRKNPESDEKEARIQLALTAMKNKKYKLRKVVHEFNIPRQTLYDRWKGKSSRNKTQEQSQLLTHAEEKELI